MLTYIPNIKSYISNRVDFKEDEKKIEKKNRENEERKLFGGCLVGKEGGKMCSGAQVFSPWAYVLLFCFI